jgi:hypothetical protein
MATIKSVELEEQEWQQIVNLLVQQNPLLMKIASQLNAATPEQDVSPIVKQPNKRHNADGKEAGHE